MPALDVVTVPDFTGPAAARFELRTLLFLGAWLQHHGQSRAWPVHLACVGSPPTAVQRMAARARARVTVHAPVDDRWPRACNKLRGFEIAPDTGSILLLDTDTLVLQDLHALADWLGHRIGLGPATFDPIPEAMWRRIFEIAALPYPDAPRAAWYYNSGVVIAPWASGLGARWVTHLARLLAVTGDAFWRASPRAVRFADQYALATAVAETAAAGTPVATMPPRYHARPPLLDEGVVRWDDTALLHYPRLLEPYGETVTALCAWLYGTRLAPWRQRLARALGLRAVRAPILRGHPPARAMWWRAFVHRIHEIVQEFGHLW
ncbi:MAG: hypothetical protein QN178_15670 [Armatimonadota bacterium]|nr:hypothetical protein [Armatimonadota bacterium]